MVMEVITRFKANDGTIFDDQSKCMEYDLLISKTINIMSDMESVPQDTDFVNGSGFVQHKPEKVLEVKRKLLELIKTKINHDWIQQTIDALGTQNVHPSWVSRLLGDYGIKCLNSAWHRFSCIDSRYREWGQPYFANNPEKGDQKRLNQ